MLEGPILLHSYVIRKYSRERFRGEERCWEQIREAFETAVKAVNAKLSLESGFSLASTSREHVMIIVPPGVDTNQVFDIADLVTEALGPINKEYRLEDGFYLSRSWECGKWDIASTVLLPLLKPKLAEAGITLPENSGGRVKVRLDLSNGETFSTEVLGASVPSRKLIFRVRPCASLVPRSEDIKPLSELHHSLPACPFDCEKVDFATGWELCEKDTFSGVTVEKITCE